jgi:O-antigen/teichoic acid export membrane protein
MKINRGDVFWNYLATILKVVSSFILLPLILKKMSSELFGIWTIFISITSFVGLLDFGFKVSFTRNISYVYAGLKNLKTKGIDVNIIYNNNIDYGLLSATIGAMRWFYLRVSMLAFILITIFGTLYINTILINYHGSHQEVYIVWILFCFVSSYNLFSMYLDALLEGAGHLKKAKQFLVISQITYVLISSILISFNFGLIAIVSAQFISVIIFRALSKKYYFDNELSNNLCKARIYPIKLVIKKIYPNAIKIGLTSLGGFITKRSSIIIGSFFLDLSNIASYGLSVLCVDLIFTFSGTYISTYIPKIAKYRVNNDLISIRNLYLESLFIQLFIGFLGGLILLYLGNYILVFLGSNTLLIENKLLLFLIIFSFLENNHSIAGNILMTNNHVPFFKASLFSGFSTIILLIIMLQIFNFGILSLVLAPGIAQLYNNFKWPFLLFSQLNLSFKEISLFIKKKIKLV